LNYSRIYIIVDEHTSPVVFILFVQNIIAQLPTPYEVDVHEWAVTLAAVLACRRALVALLSKVDQWHSSFASAHQHQTQVLTAFSLIMDPTEEHFLQVSACLHDLIPTKIDEAVASVSHAMETVVVSSLWREDWDATSPYKKGQKVSPGILALALMERSLLYTCIQVLQPHKNVLRRVCASVITAALR
jgi:hypothetical protein